MCGERMEVSIIVASAATGGAKVPLLPYLGEEEGGKVYLQARQL